MRLVDLFEPGGGARSRSPCPSINVKWGPLANANRKDTTGDLTK